MKAILVILIFTLVSVPYALTARRDVPNKHESPVADRVQTRSPDFKFITVQSLDNGLSVISWNHGRKKYWALSNMDFHKLPPGQIWSDNDNGYTVFYTQIDNTMNPPNNEKGKQVVKELLESYDAKYFVLKKVKRKHRDDIKFLDWLHEYYDENRYRMEKEFAFSKLHPPEPKPEPLEYYDPEFLQIDANSLGLSSLLPEGGIAAMMNMGNGPCIPNEGLLIEKTGTAGTYILRWFGEIDRTYFIKDSIDIVNGFIWQHEAGVGSGSEMTFTVSGYDVAGAFFRLAYTDEPYSNDFDSDGLSNFHEMIFKTDPFMTNTLMAANADEDSDGVLNKNDALPNDDTVGAFSINITSPINGSSL